MATKKVFKKAGVITSIDEIINNKYKPFIITRDTKIMPVDYKHLQIISFGGIQKLIAENRLYNAIIIEVEIERKVKQKVVPKQKSNITGCKTTLDKIYGED